MGKISIGETVSEAYSFAFGRYLSILAVIWLPVAILLVVGYFVLLPILAVVWDALQQAVQNPGDRNFPFAIASRLPQFQLADLAFRLLQLAAASVMAVGVVKEALGVRKGMRFFYLRFGLEELLVAGAYFLLLVFLAIYIFCIAIAGGISALVVGLAIHGMPEGAMMGTGGLLAALAVIAAIAGFLYLGVRLAFFVVPVTVNEREFGVFRSWELSKGHFWSIFAVLLLTWLPLIIVLYAVWGAVIAATILPGILDAVHRLGPHGPEFAKAVLAVIWTSAQKNWPWLLALALIPLPVVYGLTLSPAAFAYRQLTPVAEEAKSISH